MVLNIPTVNECCCFSLKSGSTIISILQIIWGIFAVAVGVLILTVGIARQMTQQEKQDSYYYNRDFGGNNNQYFEIPLNKLEGSARATLKVPYYVIGVLFVIFGVIGVTFGSILAHGVRKESPSLMKLWIVFRLVDLGLEVVMKIVGLVFMFSLMGLFYQILGVLISVWFIITVNSHRQNILDGSTVLGTVHSVRSEGYKPDDLA